MGNLHNWLHESFKHRVFPPDDDFWLNELRNRFKAKKVYRNRPLK